MKFSFLVENLRCRNAPSCIDPTMLVTSIGVEVNRVAGRNGVCKEIVAEKISPGRVPVDFIDSWGIVFFVICARRSVSLTDG